MAAADDFWFLEDFDWGSVQACYRDRKAACRKLWSLFRQDDDDAFARYALGMVDAAANYSADEHGLGPKVLENNLRAAPRVRQLAVDLARARDPRRVTAIIRRADIAYCRVGVGSELSCMLVPEVYWVCNSRSLWTHLLIEHGDLDDANEALELYRDNDEDSEMYWGKWGALHGQMGPSMHRLVEASRRFAPKVGKIAYFWADAICTVTYGEMAV